MSLEARPLPAGPAVSAAALTGARYGAIEDAQRLYLHVRGFLEGAVSFPPGLDPAHSVAEICEGLALFASMRSLGFYADPLIERRLREHALPSPPWASRTPADPPRRVLHYVTESMPTGGHSRVLSNWIARDGGRRHAVLFRNRSPLPSNLGAAEVAFMSPEEALNLPLAAKRLQTAATDHDVVVLHANPFDSLPLLAFAAGSPCPVLLMNHADHTFWIGANCADAIACFGPVGRHVTVTRRGTPAERTALLPLPIPFPRHDPEAKEALRRKLGLQGYDRVMLTVGAAWKYAWPDQAFFRRLAEHLADRPNVVLVVVGAAPPKEVANARGLRFVAAADPIEDYYLAADLFVDSFPTASGLAAIDAFVHGLPVVSTGLSLAIPGLLLFTLPGFPRALYHQESARGFFNLVDDLLFKPEVRTKYLARMEQAFASAYGEDWRTGGAWPQHLNAAYALAARNWRQRERWQGSLTDDMRLHIEVTPTNAVFDLQLRLARVAAERVAMSSELADVVVEAARRRTAGGRT